MAQAAFNILGFLTLFMGAFIIFNTFRTIVAERRHDIGMLRAIGAGRGTIIGLIMSEGLVQGSSARPWAWCWAICWALVIMKGMGSMLQSSSSASSSARRSSSRPWSITSVVLGVGVTLLAGLLPALSASRVTPLEVLRPMAGDKAQRIGRGITIAGAVMIVAAIVGLLSGNFAAVALGGLLFLLGLVLVGPALVKPIAGVLSGLVALAIARDGTGELAQGNITRQPTRSAITASATMIGLAIVVGAGGLMWSLQRQHDRGSSRRRWAAITCSSRPRSPSGRATSARPRSWPTRSARCRAWARSARCATPSRRFPTSGARGTGDVEISVLGIDPATYREVSGMDFTEGDPDQAYAALGEGRVDHHQRHPGRPRRASRPATR